MSDRSELILKSLGEVIARLRKEKKLTQEELGKMTGTSQMTIKRLESATVGTRVDNLVAIASALDVRLTDLFQEIEGLKRLPKSRGSKWDQLKDKVDDMTAIERKWLSEVLEKILVYPR